MTTSRSACEDMPREPVKGTIVGPARAQAPALVHLGEVNEATTPRQVRHMRVMTAREASLS
ncbi:hypothetical protein I3I95_01625 [bacterium]|nr:hypothetical protein [bacterium]